MTTESLFQPIFKEMVERYKMIFSCIYPAFGKTGFTERNLTSNFVAASESVYGKDCRAWFEMPIRKSKKEHFDAMLWDQSQERNFLAMIEAKRFSNPENKMHSFLWDILRMTSENAFSEVALCQGGDRYIIALADVWLDTKPKKKIFEKWSPEYIREEWDNFHSVEKTFPASFPAVVTSEYCFKFEITPNLFAEKPRHSYCIVGYAAQLIK